MKKLMILALMGFAMSFTSAKAQGKDEKIYDFTSVQKQPIYPGGISSFYHYIRSEIKYPDVAKKNNIKGKVFASFVVENDGSLTDVKIVRGLSKETDAEAIRVLKNSPKWAPAVLNGKTVRVKYNINVNFDLDKQTNKQTKANAEVNRTPEYPGGLTKLYSYLGKNLRYPAQARKDKISGKVMLSFFVEEDGSLSNMNVLKGLSKETDEEALRVMKSSPKWNPGIDESGHTVKTKYVMNINFVMS